MRRYSRIPLSESEDWRGILIDQVVSPGNLIHVTSPNINVIDVLHLWAEHTNASGGGLATITVEFGGLDVPRDLMVRDIPIKSALSIVPGRCLSGDSLEVRVFSTLGSDINVWGFINRIHQ